MLGPEAIELATPHGDTLACKTDAATSNLDELLGRRIERFDDLDDR